MSRVCLVCRSDRRDEVDRRLLEGASPVEMAKRFGLSRYSVARHARHLPRLLARSTKAAQVARADDLLGRLEELQQDARRIQANAERAGNLTAALAAIRELVRIVELLARMRGELIGERRTTNVLNVNLDAETAERIARTYLLRRRGAPEPAELP